MTPHLLFISEVLRDVEHVTDLLRRLALDHVSNGLAAHVTECHELEEIIVDACGKSEYSQEGLDVEIVGGEDNLKEHLLVNSDELLIPFTDIRRPLARVILLLRRRARVVLVVRAPFEDLQ